jgi:Tol biopolymer transport system component
VQLGLAGCTAGGVGAGELVQPPIAVLYWDRQAARDRADAQAELRRPHKLGVADVGDLGRAMGLGSGAEQQVAQRYPGHLALVDPATGAVRRIEQVPPSAVPLAWSPDHSALLLAAPSRRGGVQLYEYRVAEQELRLLTTGPPSHVRGDYGPGRRLVSVAELAGGRSRIELAAGAAAERRIVFEGPAVYDVRWSPRGDMLLLAVIDSTRRERGGGGARMLFALSPEAPPQAWPPGPGSMLEPLGRGRDPVFSPDGEWIVYSARVGGGWRLRRMRAEGGGRLPLGRGVRDEIEPAVSPDGSLVAYVSEEGGLHRLFVRRIDGSGDRLLLPDGAVARPVW